MLAFVRKSALAASVLALLGTAPLARAQDIDVDGSLGNYYQNLYVQTHIYGALTGHGGRTHRFIRRVHAAPVWNIASEHSAVISRLTAHVPPARRPADRALLQKVIGLYPGIVRFASKSQGVALYPSSTPDTATLAGVLSYEYLIGHDISRAQFIAELNATRRLYPTQDYSASEMQQNGETYAMAVCLMGVLKAYENNPQNTNPQLTRHQLHELALYTFRTAYQSADYTKFAATDRGIIKVSQ